MRRVPIRLKFAGALAVPLVALVAVVLAEVARTVDDRSEIREQTDLARTAIGPTGLLITLQNERTWPSLEIFGFDDTVNVPVEGYRTTRAQTDAAIDAFRAQLSHRGDAVAATFQPALEGLADLDQLRSDIDEFRETEHSTPDTVVFGFTVFDRYTEVITPFFDATTQVVKAIDDPDLREGSELSDAVAREIETSAVLVNTTIIDAVLTPRGVDQPDEITELSILRTNLLRYADVLEGAGGPYAPIAEERYPRALIDGLSDQVDRAIDTRRISVDDLLANLDTTPGEGLFGYQDAVHDIINDRADELDAEVESRQLRLGGLAVTTVVAAALLTWLVSRSITAPLRSLTRQAKEMAGRGLPDAVRDVLDTPLGDDVDVPEIKPVAVGTRDEVADVANALNSVQDAALDLALEQAVLRRNIADSFVNLGRRNQNLLGRQLDFITELESHEIDAEVLASLFQLDHLATRMRRNAESLLVLAGIEPPRKWAAPVRLADVVRAALGEVEEYQRVRVFGLEPATVVGSAAADLIHLIAELVENALTFSPPDRKVEVRGRRQPGNGGYALVIVDSGPGMSAGGLAQANRRLAGEEAFTVAPSKYLGHYVAGNLAHRLGVRVWLEAGLGNGLTVTVTLPPQLLPSSDTGDPGPPSDTRPSVAARAVPDAAGARDAEPAGAPVDASGAAEPAAVRDSKPAAVRDTAGSLGSPGAAAAGPAAARVTEGGAAPPDEAGAEPGPAGGTETTGEPLAPPRVRTPSGLVKRVPQAGERRPAAPAAGALRKLTSDKLDALAEHAGRARPDSEPAARRDADAGAGAEGPGAGAGTKGRSGKPPAKTKGRKQAGRAAAADADTGAEGPGAGAGTKGRSGKAPATPKGRTAGAAGPPGPAAPSRSRPSPSRGTGSRPGRISGRAPGHRRGRRAGDGESGPRGRSAAPATGGWTVPPGGPTASGGLTRRVKGAQLPTRDPRSITRGPSAVATSEAEPGSAGGARGVSSARGQTQDVYSLLSKFAAGVQRGLDEAREPGAAGDPAETRE